MDTLYKDADGQIYSINSIQEPKSGWVELTEAETEAHLNTPPAPMPAAQSVSRSQGKMALLQAGLLQQVEAFIGTIDDVELQAMARIAFTDAGTWERSSPTLNALAYGLGLDDLALDALFIAAAEVRL